MDPRTRDRKIAGISMETSELNLSAGSAGDVIFSWIVPHQKIELIGLGLRMNTNSGGAVASGEEAILRVQKQPKNNGTLVTYDEPSQLLSFPAASMIAPDSVYTLLRDNVEGNTTYDLSAGQGYPTAVEGDRIEIAKEQLATGVRTQQGRPFIEYRELTDGVSQRGPS